MITVIIISRVLFPVPSLTIHSHTLIHPSTFESTHPLIYPLIHSFIHPSTRSSHTLQPSPYLLRSTACNITCMKTLLRLLHHHNIYKDVFREVGLIEVLVLCLQRYHAHLSDGGDQKGSQQDKTKDATGPSAATTTATTTTTTTTTATATSVATTTTTTSQTPATTATTTSAAAATTSSRAATRGGDGEDEEQVMGFLVLDALLLLLNNDNAGDTMTKIIRKIIP